MPGQANQMSAGMTTRLETAEPTTPAATRKQTARAKPASLALIEDLDELDADANDPSGSVIDVLSAGQRFANAGRGREDIQTWLTIIPGTDASSGPALPTGAPM
jgi:hypothetical protein